MALLLRRSAAGPGSSGPVHLERVDGSVYLEFRHRVVRVWEQPVEWLLGGGLATLPLAPLGDLEIERLPDVIRRIGERLRAEASPEEAGTLLAATYWLLGARYPPGVAARMLEGMRAILEQESWTYQDTLDRGEARGRAEGRAEEARRILLRLGERRFGPPSAAVQATLEDISDLERLERLADRMLEAATWDELLATS